MPEPEPAPEPEPVPEPEPEPDPVGRWTDANDPEVRYIVNLNTGKFHYRGCSSVAQMNESNKGFFTGTRDELISKGYEPCGRCHP